MLIYFQVKLLIRKPALRTKENMKEITGRERELSVVLFLERSAKNAQRER